MTDSSIPAVPAAGSGDQGAAQHRDYLYRYALLHLRDANRAEDVVQETLLAAVENQDRFSGKSSLRTWLTGILKHKIIDVFRRQSREAPLESGLEAESDEAFGDLYFDPQRTDHWHTFPQTWGDPERSLEDKRFWEVFDQCSQQMPLQVARAFYMREIMGLETDEICKELSITATNCWVMLYRARMSLRQCLELRWFSAR
ncbi:MAG TPA: sigma-70 family RNA polymerase sigma factor [Burkholderiales bacterium]|nr:sigma-70 family RNA polymerase sigma factor [Burkholderiales bacterium]